MKNLLRVFAIAMLLLAHSAYAREVAVLLPVTGPLTPLEISEFSKQVVDGLSARFELMYGDEVDRFVKQAFQDESKKQDCDETNCYRRIASRYQAEKIIALRVRSVMLALVLSFGCWNTNANGMERLWSRSTDSSRPASVVLTVDT